MVFEVWLHSELAALLRFADTLCGNRSLAEEIADRAVLVTELARLPRKQRAGAGLELALDVGDRATWFDAEQAVPN